MYKSRSYKQRGAGLGDGTGAGAGAASGVSGFDALKAGSSVQDIVLSDAAAYKIIPQGVTEQGMAFQKMTSSYHRSRKHRSRKQRGGALTPAPFSSLGEVLPSTMTGPMTTVASGVLGGSGTGVLDRMLTETNGLVRQTGGGSRKRKNRKGKKQSRKQNRQQQNRQQQNRQQQNRQQQNRQQQNRNRKSQKQRGGALGFGPAAPASGNYNILTPQELTKAGLNPQFFDENQVNPNFGGAIVVPGGKLN